MNRDGGAVRAGRALVALALLMPIVLLALASWYNRVEVVRASEIRVERTLRVLQEHAIKVFETQKLILDRIDGRLRNMDWDSEAQRAELHAFLASLQADYEQIATLTITDADGRMLAGSRLYPADPAISFAARDWFRAVKASAASSPRTAYVSTSLVGRQSGLPVFNLAQAVVTRAGAFSGVIALSVDRSYFEDFYREIDPDPDHSVVLIRTDGELLARHPATTLTKVAIDTPMFRGLDRENVPPFLARSTIDGVPRFFAFAKVAAYPIHIGFGLSEAAVDAQWWRNVLAFAPVAGLAALALLAASIFALRQTHAHQIRAWCVPPENGVVGGGEHVEEAVEAHADGQGHSRHQLRTAWGQHL